MGLVLFTTKSTKPTNIKTPVAQKNYTTDEEVVDDNMYIGNTTTKQHKTSPNTKTTEKERPSPILLKLNVELQF